MILGAADTFRAAAIEQVQLWGERVGVPVIAHTTGADPGAVAFDTVGAAMARGIDRRDHRHRRPPADEEESDGGAGQGASGDRQAASGSAA